MPVNTLSQHNVSNLQRIGSSLQLYRSPLSHVFNANIHNLSIPHSSRQFNFSSLRHLRNIHLEKHFYRFPQLETGATSDMAAWNRSCRSLASMGSLRNLCISLKEARFFIDTRVRNENAKLVAGVLEPLKSIKVGETGHFDVVTRDWGLLFPPSNVPFQLITE